MKIGPHLLKNNLMLAPMAGVTDRPFRQLCRKLGAGMVVSEMITSDPTLQNRRKTKYRMASRATRHLLGHSRERKNFVENHWQTIRGTFSLFGGSLCDLEMPPIFEICRNETLGNRFSNKILQSRN